MTLPWWVPFNQLFAIVVGIVVGRWIGGLLGYQPFYAEWSTDWDVACQTMNKTWTQRRFARPEAQEKAKQRFLKEGWFSSKAGKQAFGPGDRDNDSGVGFEEEAKGTAVL